MLIIVVTSNWGKYTNYFHKSKEKAIFLDCTIECELCVYGQETGRIREDNSNLLRTQLGASLN